MVVTTSLTLQPNSGEGGEPWPDTHRWSSSGSHQVCCQALHRTAGIKTQVALVCPAGGLLHGLLLHIAAAVAQHGLHDMRLLHLLQHKLQAGSASHVLCDAGLAYCCGRAAAAVADAMGQAQGQELCKGRAGVAGRAAGGSCVSDAAGCCSSHTCDVGEGGPNGHGCGHRCQNLGVVQGPEHAAALQLCTAAAA